MLHLLNGQRWYGIDDLLIVKGSYVMYTHMMKQRRRQTKGKAPVRRNRVDTLQR